MNLLEDGNTMPTAWEAPPLENGREIAKKYPHSGRGKRSLTMNRPRWEETP